MNQHYYARQFTRTQIKAIEDQIAREKQGRANRIIYPLVAGLLAWALVITVGVATINQLTK